MLLLDNRIDSVFGRGWELQGVQSMIAGDGSSPQIDDGNGPEGYDPLTDPSVLDCPRPPGSRVYVSRLDGRTTLEQLANGQWIRTLQDGTQYTYDPAFAATSNGNPPGATTPLPVTRVVDRYGNVTEYHHDAAGHLTAIVDPVGLKTEFAYSG